MAKRKKNKNKSKNYNASKKNNPHYFSYYEADSKDIQAIAYKVFGSTYYSPNL